MLQEKAHVGAVESHAVISIPALYLPGPVQGFSEVRADDVFIPQLSSERGLSGPRLEPSVQIHPDDIGPVVVERVGLRI